MLEIMFHGKRLDNGEWVEGFLFVRKDTQGKIMEAFIIVDAYEQITLGQRYVRSNLNQECFRVIPETVGQFSGRTDKNGKRIWEGDMIKPFDDEIDKMVVEFHHGQFLLCLYGERGYMAEYGWEEEGNYGCFEAEPLSSYGDDIEVIGNIYDNSELLKGGEG